ncbi:spore germination protein [Metabacillus halosaccharovorans]|uniref:Spore germination protein n=1 Tax=Metabacillus halosaccharovorans TaxID=930124 RepID=A0ABT3DLT2_9BACI|nr:spore germination protein [Metabacillus halosaccharovorans]MCV9888011.1 spore germination protein [Metabacillus halosaccharovorans]
MVKQELKDCLQENISNIKNTFHHTSDLIARKIKTDNKSSFEINVVYLDGIIDTDRIQEYVVKPLLEPFKTVEFNESLIDEMIERFIEAADVNTTNQYNDLIDAIVQGNTVILINGYQKGIIVPSAKWKERSLEESLGERSPRGPVVGLTEQMKTNINLIRSSIKTPDLCVEAMEFGTISKTAVSILFIEGTVDKGILMEVRKRLNGLKIKYLLNSKVVEDALEGKPKTFFNLVRTTVRIDGVTSSLYEGRVAIIVDGIPHAIVAPTLFMEMFQSPDEYHIKMGWFTNRLIRMIAFILAVYLPGVYVAIANFHKKDLPNNLSKALITKDELMPTFWEMLFLLFFIRILFDSSFRIPKSAVILLSLIGTIVVGETAVTAKLIHPVSLIIVGITAICSYLLANRGTLAAENILRFLFMIIAHFFGFSGMIIAATIQIIYMVSLKSIGVPFLSPVIPFKMKELKDIFIRADLQTLINSKNTYTEDED